MNMFGDMYIYVGVDGTGEKRDMTGARHTVPFLAKTSSKICSVVTCTDRSVGHQGRPLTTIRVGYQFDWFADTDSVLRRPATLIGVVLRPNISAERSIILFFSWVKSHCLPYLKSCSILLYILCVMYVFGVHTYVPYETVAWFPLE